MAVGSNAYTELGASSNLSYNTNNRTLTVPATTITNNTAAISPTTGALRVVGGVGIGGDLHVGGEIVASKLTIELTTVTTTLVVTDDIIQTLNETQATSTITGALRIAGGAGIGKNLYVGGTIYGNIDGTVTYANTATNIRNGTIGQVPFQSAPGTTQFFGPGDTGQILVSQGISATGPVFVSTGSIYVGRAALADDLVGGLVGSLPYQNAANSTVFLNLGTEGNVLLAGASAPRWGSLADVVTGESTTATHIKFGTINQVPYQTAPGRTSFFGPGAAGQLLVSNGTTAGGPIFTSTSSIYVGRAALADDLVGGAAGSIPYQTGTNDTVFLALGTAGHVLLAGATGPVWSSLENISAGEATTATHIKLGTAGQVPYQTAPGRTSFFGPGTLGQVMISGGVNGPFYLNTSTLYVGRAQYADELFGGTVGSLPYQSAANDTSFLALGTAGHILVARAGGPVWETTAGLSAGNASTASNLALGTVNQIPYQTAPGVTGFFGPGTEGQLLVSNGTAAGGPVFTTTSSIYVGRAALADDLVGGAAGSLPYQNAENSTIFLALGSAGFVLTAGATGPVWTALSGLSAGTTANIGGGTANQIVYQSGPGSTSFILAPTVAGTYLQWTGSTWAWAASVGPQGPQGVQGPQGPVGPQGPGGGNGTPGVQGPQGPQGAQGPQGVQGPQGPQGPQGVQGPQGPQGVQGPTGPAATNGTNGAPGVQGPQGVQGPTGPPSTVAGPSGPSGPGLTISSDLQINSLGVGTPASGVTGEIRATNEITAYFSDRRLKENIEIIKDSLEKVLKISGVTYTGNRLAEKFGYDRHKRQVGLLADEVEAVLPEIIRPAPFDIDKDGNSKSGENYKTVQYEKIVPLLVEAIKALAAEIEELKKKNN
jgi:hypothetical protein